ncbi:hypothetical protein SZN_33016 [Streptomyces zinciresistens K42]|uniref:DUF397 domain-containing protein n=1 Tax=Streptomyces zinciresistens K42 TaxID=700597 RepID=G2GM51_9ACTN|nr:DUF397 domain-containing protein [Streptomyces zinciresistens]EGX55419.1 hypothetical protein SZN_33016 [Streptomyces zinciresistens K42]
MADETKMNTLKALLAADLSEARWTKSDFSGGSPNDCLEVTAVEGLGYVLRHSVLTEHRIPLTTSEYEAYVKGVQAGQPGLMPNL